MIRIYTQPDNGRAWLNRFRERSPLFACILGFTETGLIPGISAAGATPESRRLTAIADIEFLHNGPCCDAQYPLPPLTAGASPVFISRAVLVGQRIPSITLNAGLPIPPPTPFIELHGQSAQCLSTGHALDSVTVRHLFERGLAWGTELAMQIAPGYLVVGECVVGGTTTALAVLAGLGWDAFGMVNSSHPTCNHAQKQTIVQQGLQRAALKQSLADPFQVLAAVGDPMQPVAAGIAIAASRITGVLLAGGTQMLAVWALAQAIAQQEALLWHPAQVMVGTTRWVADDPTGDTVGLAAMVGAPLLATQLSFATSHYPQLRVYEDGFVKEGVGAGGCAIAAHLYQEWGQPELLNAIEQLVAQYSTLGQRSRSSPIV